MLVWNQFRATEPAPCDSPWIRQQLGSYMSLIVRPSSPPTPVGPAKSSCSLLESRFRRY
jgi:hypothetical protein